MQTRLRGQYNGKWAVSLVCVSRPLVTVITAITAFLFQCDPLRARCSVFAVFTLSFWPCLWSLRASFSKKDNLDSSTNASRMTSKWSQKSLRCMLTFDSLKVTFCAFIVDTMLLPRYSLSTRPSPSVTPKFARKITSSWTVVVCG